MSVTRISTLESAPSAARTDLRRHRVWVLVAVAAVLAGHAVAVWVSRPPGILTGQDDAVYTLLAESLREGSYRDTWRIDEPIHSQYPPMYPAILALAGTLGGSSFDSFAATTLLFSLAALAVTFLAVNRRFGAGIALASITLLALNPELVTFAGGIQTEMPFAFFTMLCLYALLRVEDAKPLAAHVDSNASDGTANRWLGLACACAIAAAMTRTVGVTLVGAVGVWLLLARRWKAALFFAAASAATVGAWLYWTSVAPEQFVGRSYMAELREVATVGSSALRRVSRNIYSYLINEVPYILAVPTVPGTPIDNVIACFVIWLATGVGLIRFVRRWRPALLFMITYTTLLSVWFWRVDRFVVPILPVLIPAILIGIGTIAGRVRASWRVPAIAGAFVFLAAGAIPRLTEFVAAAATCDRGTDLPAADCIASSQVPYFEALRFIHDNLAADAVVMTVKSGALYIYTGRRSTMSEGPLAQHPDDFVDYVKGLGARYVLLTDLHQTEPRMASLLQANCGRITLVRSFSLRTHLFELTEPSPSEPGTGAKPSGCDALAEYIRSPSNPSRPAR